MGIQSQARYTGTPLSRFLDEYLPQRNEVVREWARQGNPSRPEESPLTGGRDDVGWALELCIELDLASTPPRLPELSHLPVERCTALLTAAGFERAGALHSAETTDPVLQHWKRTHHQIVINERQKSIFSACLDLASFCQPMHHWGVHRTVEERRALFASAVALGNEENNVGHQTELIDALIHCWNVYLSQGRRALLGLGEKVVVAPELAHGYGVADLVIGQALVEIKLAIEPTTDDMAAWLRQLLGYVLLDQHDTFRFDTVSVYCAWSGKLLTCPLPEILTAASPGRTPSLEHLRIEFHKALHDELEGYVAWKERQQYR